MTRLTMTRMALGSLRGQKKRYFSLASGIFLAVFFATALVLASASLGKTMRDDYRARMGEQDVALLNIDATEETTRQTGIAQRVGTVGVFGEIAASPEADAARVTFGRYDETAAALARSIRNRLLKDSDAEVALDRLGLVAPSGSTFTAWLGFLKALGEALIGEWAQYRQALRDLPEQDGFPFSIVWPSAPGSEAADAEAEEFAP